jgi:2-iminoacetate synthase ThiH
MLIEGEDFYFDDNGYMVFTEKYHLNRGYCCKNGCRYCPWKFKKDEKEEDEKNN